MSNAQKFRQTSLPRQPGEIVRLKVVQGPDYGSTFVVFAAQFTIGRGEDSDVMVTDLKASRKHAAIMMGPRGWKVDDLGSANGIVHNGKVTRAAELQAGDTITIGETSLEFLTAQEGTQLLKAPPRTNVLQLNAVADSAFEEQRNRVRSLGKGGRAMPAAPKAPGSAGKGKLLMVVVAVAGLGALYLSQGQDGGAKAKRKKPALSKEVEAANEARDLASFLPASDVPREITNSAETLFKQGFRDFNRANYIRARGAFEAALQINPGHRLAREYLQNTTLAIDTEVRTHLERGKKSNAAGKDKSARDHFGSVMRLLYRDTTNPAFIEAKEQLEKLNHEKAGGA